jgi:exonuclease III
VNSSHLLPPSLLSEHREHPHGRKALYTFWVNDEAFRRNAGFRMDFLLVSPSLLGRLLKAEVDVAYRGREKPSDHTPVIQSQCRHQMRSWPTKPWNFWRETFTHSSPR